MEVRKPTFCSIEVVYSCILKCKMCHMWKNPRSPQEISIEDWKKFIIGLKEFSGTNISINITGGEPFLKDDVLGLVRYAAQEGFKDISMTTNGFLIDSRLAREVSASGLNMISFSLDSIDADIHDDLRGIKGSCQKVMAAIECLLKDKGSTRKIGIQTIIMGPTLEGIPALVQWARERGISIYFMAISQPLCVPLGPDWFCEGEYSFLWPKDSDSLNDTIGFLIESKEKGVDIGNSLAQLRAFKSYFAHPNDFVKKERRCRMDDGMLKVGPTGETALCSQKGPIGNISNNTIKDIWYSPRAQEIREAIGRCKTNCPQMINCYFEE